MLKLSIITTHPIQYYAPIFQLLQDRGNIAVHVYYTAGEQKQNLDVGFRQSVSWDIPLLEGYSYEWVRNTSADPGSHHHKGIINPDLINIIACNKPDAILVFGWNYHSHLAVMRHFKRSIPIYFRGDSTLLNEDNLVKKALRKIYLRWVYRHIDHAFYVGKNNRDYFQTYGLLERQLSFAPHAIDNARFALGRNEEATLFRLGLNIPEEGLLILYAGKFEPVKNVKLLINAVSALDKQNVYLVLVGNGIAEKELKDLASEQRAGHRIIFRDFINQTGMPAVYQAADLFCLPSVAETWGLAVNEAMACRTAILVSDSVGCAVDLVKEGYNGGIFKSRDQNDLLKQLKTLTQSTAKLRQYGQNSGKLIQDWNFTKIAEAIEKHMFSDLPFSNPGQ